MSANKFTKFDNYIKSTCTAKNLSSADRQEIALQAIEKIIPITKLAEQYGTSRKFIYRQKEIGTQAIKKIFKQNSEDSNVLFYLPVTAQWLSQFILCLILMCRSSYRGVMEILSTMFSYKTSLGSIHNIVQKAIDKVRELDEKEDLSSIKTGAPDEIFQGDKPVLAACDTDSLYCYLLKQADHRDGDTWAVHLMECQDKGLDLDYTIADFGKGLRAGQNEAMPGLPCLGDHFHVLYEMGKAGTFLNNRADRTGKIFTSIEKKMEKAKKKGKGHKLSKKIVSAKTEAFTARQLADDFGTLTEWMQELLSPIGPDFQTREGLFDFIVKELQERECLAGKHRVGAVRRLLENNKKEILLFAKMIDQKWKILSEELEVDEYLLRKMYEMESLSFDNPRYYELEKLLRQRLRGKFYFVQEAVSKIEQLVTRASSAIENFNSRLRNYFFLRKQLGVDYLILLRFFLNQRRFLASDDVRRVGKSPAEIMLGEELPHWLEQLDFELFNRAA